jgi:hypothetical protein
MNNNKIIAKKHYYNKLITNSKNKIKATWGIIRTVTNAKTNNNVITSVSSEEKSYNKPQTMVSIYINYFIMPSNEMQFNKFSNASNSLSYLFEMYNFTFPNINRTPVEEWCLLGCYTMWLL